MMKIKPETILKRDQKKSLDLFFTYFDEEVSEIGTILRKICKPKLRSALKQKFQFLDLYRFMESRGKIEGLVEEAFSNNDFFPKEETERLFDHMPLIMVKRTRKLIHNLKEKLQNRGFWNQFIEYREESRELKEVWASTISAHTMNMFQTMCRVTNSQVEVSWPLLMDSYIRDFEIIVQFFVRNSASRLQSQRSYQRDLESFFGEQFKQDFNVENIQILNPHIRNAFSHQKYIYNSLKEEVTFFAMADCQEFTISMASFIEIVKSLNQILWMIIVFIIEEQSSEEIDPLFALTREDLEHIKTLLLYLVVEQNSVLSSHKSEFYTSIRSLFAQHTHQSTCPYYLYESYTIYKLLNKAEAPSISFTNIIADRMAYLAGYELIKERLLIPFAKACYPKQIEDIEKIDSLSVTLFNNSFGGEFTALTHDFDPVLKNAVAHTNYINRDPTEYKDHPYFMVEYQSNNNLNDKRKTLLKGMTMVSTYQAIESALDPEKEYELLIMGLGSLLYFLLLGNNDLSPQYWNRQADNLHNINIPKKYIPVSTLVQFLCELQCTNNKDELEKNLRRHNSWFQDLSLRHETLYIMYWYYILLTILTNRKPSFLNLPVVFDSLKKVPKSSEGRSLFYLSKYIYWKRKRNKEKAQVFLKQYYKK